MKTEITYKVLPTAYDDQKYGLLPLTICELYDVGSSRYEESFGLGWMVNAGLRMLQHDLLEHWQEGYGICRGKNTGKYFGELIALGQLLYLKNYSNLRGISVNINIDILNLISDLCEEQSEGHRLDEEFIPDCPTNYIEEFDKYNTTNLSDIVSLAFDKAKQWHIKLPKGCTELRAA
jgi:hypothetical protein